VTQAWFSVLGEPLSDDETREIAAYLAGLGMNAAMPIHQALIRLERSARLDPADPEWLALNEALHGAAAGGHPFLRKYALYCGGRWPLGLYHGRFAIF
jgi:hypothetical protein